MSDAKPAAPAKGSKKKLIVIILAVLVLLLAAGGGAAVYLMKKKQAEADADEDGHAQVDVPAKKKAKAPSEHPPVFVPLDNFIVNLADRDADRYLQLGVTLQVADAKTGEQIKSYLPAIRNNILLLLSRKTVSDLAGAAGKDLLALQVRAAAVRGMGVEVDEADIALPEPAGSAAQPRRRKDPTLDWPVEAVQFSSLLIQ